MKQRTISISQSAIKGRVGGVFKNKGRVFTRGGIKKPTEDFIKSPPIKKNRIEEDEKLEEVEEKTKIST